jgi:hypothetical protein
MQPLALKNRRYWLPGCGLRRLHCLLFMHVSFAEEQALKSLIFPTLRHGVFLHFTSFTHLLFL